MPSNCGICTPEVAFSCYDLPHISEMEVLVVPEKLRTLDRGRPWRDSQFASTRLSPSRDMSR